MKKDRAEAREILLHCPPVDGAVSVYEAILRRIAKHGADGLDELHPDLLLGLVECLAMEVRALRRREAARTRGLDDTSRQSERHAVEDWWVIEGHKLPVRRQVEAARNHLTERGMASVDDSSLRAWLKHSRKTRRPGIMYTVIGKTE